MGKAPKTDGDQSIAEPSVLLQRETALRDLVRHIHAAGQASDLDEVLDYVFKAFRSVIPYDRIGCALLTDDGRKVRAYWARSELGPIKLPTGYTRALANSSLAHLLETDEPRIIPDLEAYLASKPSSDATRRIVAEGGRSSLTCPLHADGKPVGFLFFTSRHRDTYTTVHKATFQIVADVVGTVVAGVRLREQRDAEEATRQALSDAVPANIALLDTDGTILEVNAGWRRFARQNGYKGEDFGVGRNYLELCDQVDDSTTKAAASGIRAVLAGETPIFAQEYPCHSPTEERWYHFTVKRAPETDGRDPVARAVVMHVDITARVQAEREVERTAYEDRLTGLPSRAGFLKALGERLQRGADHPASMVILLDVVALRDINEAYGYDSGDLLLQQIGERLRGGLGERGLLARIGGDEFALFVPVDHDVGPHARRAAIARVFEDLFEVRGISVSVAARFGYTRLRRADRAPEELIREAELAMFQTRPELGDLWHQYTTALDREARARIQLTRALREGLERDEFQLHFQPKVDLATGRVLACEALIRWNHPERGFLLPGRFMPVAEQSQLMGPIGAWVLNEACRSLRAWIDDGLDVVRVAVNVSVVQLTLGDFPDKVRAALSEHGLEPDALTLEITESAFEKHAQVLRVQLDELHAMGVRLALDDFGTGYSSLLYLQRYPFDEIKVDKGFVQRMTTEPFSHELVATVVGLAGALGATVVAEGVETPAERDALMALGCTTGQGFHYSMPLADEDFRWVLETRETLTLNATVAGTP